MGKFKKELLFLSTLLIFSFFMFTPSVAMAEEDTPPIAPYTMPWCTQHEGCGRYGIRNRTDYWVQVYLNNMATKEKGFFTILSGDNVYLKVRPGFYKVTYVWWCSGKMDSMTKYWGLTQYWTDVFSCPGGFSGGIYRGGST